MNRTRPLPALILMAIAASGALAAERLDPESLAKANRVLQGKRAIVELSSGEVFVDARQVFIGPEWTTWEEAGETRQADTNDIQRVSLSKRARILKWSRRGLLVGGVLGGVGVGHSEADGTFVEPLDPANVAKGALSGAAVGAAAGSIAGGKVVFESGAASG